MKMQTKPLRLLPIALMVTMLAMMPFGAGGARAAMFGLNEGGGALSTNSPVNNGLGNFATVQSITVVTFAPSGTCTAGTTCTLSGTFEDTGNHVHCTSYNATIVFGDGSTTTVAGAGSGFADTSTCTFSATHTYASASSGTGYASTASIARTQGGNSYISNVEAASVVVLPAADCATPSITTQPVSTTVSQGGNATFTVAATDYTSIQWQVSTDGGTTWTDLTNAAPYSGVTTNTLTVAAVTGPMDQYQYRAVLTNDTGGCTASTATTSAATLTVTTNGSGETITILTFNVTCTGLDCTATGTADSTGSFACSSYKVDVAWGDGSITKNVALTGGTANVAPYCSFPSGLTHTYASGGSYTVTATVHHGNISSQAATFQLIVGGVDLAVTKTVDNTTPASGSNVTFTVTVTNNGPATATGVTLTDALPVGLTFVSATPSQGGYTSGTGAWSVGTLNNGSSATLTITATATGTSPLTNTATLTNSTPADTNAANNSASATVSPSTAMSADLSITKTASNLNPTVGSSLTFTVSVTNNGPDTATNVVVTDTPPAGISFLPGAGTWTFASMVSGATETLSIPATVTASGPITNTATVTSDTPDSNLANNSASATLNAVAPTCTAPTITTQPTDATVSAGGNATFTVAGTGYTSIQWQVSTDGGATWSDITDGGVYSGATTATLTVTGVTAAMSGNQYQAVLTNSPGGCTASTTTSAAVTLTVSNLLAAAGTNINCTAGVPCTGVVATFTDTSGAACTAANFTASIDWGDGSTSAGTIGGTTSAGGCTVTGTHTYAVAGSYPITTTITDTTSMLSQTVVSTATVVVGGQPTGVCEWTQGGYVSTLGVSVNWRAQGSPLGVPGGWLIFTDSRADLVNGFFGTSSLQFMVTTVQQLVIHPDMSVFLAGTANVVDPATGAILATDVPVSFTVTPTADATYPNNVALTANLNGTLYTSGPVPVVVNSINVVNNC